MKVADNLHRHKILDKFEFRQDCTITLELLALECEKTTHILLRPEHSLCNF